MEIDEMPVQPVTPEPQLILNEQAQYYLLKAGQWAYFLGIMGFIGTAFIAIMALFVGTIFTTMAALNPMMAGAAGSGGAVTVLYLLIAAVNFFLCLVSLSIWRSHQKRSDVSKPGRNQSGFW